MYVFILCVSMYWCCYELFILQISSAPPPFIPRQPLPAIEAPPTSDHMMLKFSPSPPHSFATSPSSSQLSSEGGEDGEGGEDVVEDTQEQQEGIFMTQVHVHVYMWTCMYICCAYLYM